MHKILCNFELSNRLRIMKNSKKEAKKWTKKPKDKTKI